MATVTGGRMEHELMTRGDAFAALHLEPLLDEMRRLESERPWWLLEWAIPGALWDPKLLDGPSVATFFGLPLVRDDELTEPQIRHRP